jgi:catechol 2,3-dioxygenase-like lactoylglutathione lyase family enzyme
MSRIQLALNVSDIDAAVDFYQKMFGTEPGYANFAISEPPLKLVLIENAGAAGRLNHLGVEVSSSEQVLAARDHLHQSKLSVTVEDQVTCCYALQDKVWVKDPDGAAWEVYTVLEDSAAFGESSPEFSESPTQSSVCCS